VCVEFLQDGAGGKKSVKGKTGQNIVKEKTATGGGKKKGIYRRIPKRGRGDLGAQRKIVPTGEEKASERGNMDHLRTCPKSKARAAMVGKGDRNKGKECLQWKGATTLFSKKKEKSEKMERGNMEQEGREKGARRPRGKKKKKGN